MAYYLGVVCGIATAGLVVFLIAWAIKKLTHAEKGDMVAKYDERQDAIRGIAFKYGFYTLLIGLTIKMVLDIGEIKFENPVVFNQFADFILLLVGIMVYVSIAIWKNAYVGINQKFKTAFTSLTVIAVCNLIIGFINMHTTQWWWINFFLGVMMAIICAEMAMKRSMDNRNEAAEEED